VEEHNIIGGLGSLIAEIIATERLNIQLIRIGLNDKFSVGYGTLLQVRKENGLDADSITDIIRKTMI
jgi:transketolase